LVGLAESFGGLDWIFCLGASVTKHKFCVVSQPFIYFSWCQPFYFDVGVTYNPVSVQQV